MSKGTWIILGIIFASCRAHFGFHQSDEQLPSSQSAFRQSADVLLRTVGIRPEDHQCFTLARRPFVVNRMVQLPCNSLMPGMPLMRSYMGPFGPVCESYIRNTVYRYYRMPLCCSGFTTDPSSGRCTLRTGDLPPTLQSQPQWGNMMDTTSQMRHAMWIKAKRDMATKREMLLMSVRDSQQKMPPGMSMMPRIPPGIPMMPRMPPGMPMMPRMPHGMPPGMPMMPRMVPGMVPEMVPGMPMMPKLDPKISLTAEIPMLPRMLPRMPMTPNMMPRMPMTPHMMPRMTHHMMPGMPMTPHMMPGMPMTPDMMPGMSMTPHMMPKMLMTPNMMPTMPMVPRSQMTYVIPLTSHSHMLPMAMTRPPYAPLFNAFSLNRMPQSRIDFLNFGNPFKPPMPHPVQQPPLSGRVVNLMVTRTPFPFIARNNIPVPLRPVMMVKPLPMISRQVLSQRINLLPYSKLNEFHPSMPSLPEAPRIEQSFSDMQSSEFPTIPNVQNQSNIDQPDGFQGGSEFQRQETATNDGFHATPPTQEAHVTDNMIPENIPYKAVEMPELIVEQALAIAESCIARLDASVKACLKQNNIDVPDVMSAFEPFNDDKSRELCKAEDGIFKCITDSLNDCNNSNDADMAREMLMETAQTVKNMCGLRDLSAQDSGIEKVSKNTNGVEAAATAENVDAPTNDVTEASTISNSDELEIRVTQSLADAFKEAVQQEVHVQELNGYVMPILIGSGIGFMILVMFTSLLVCCCRKRKLRRKTKIAKELEKPAISNGVYTIGIPPPVYEANGIPHVYCEEEKGEKITSMRPAVQEGAMVTKVGGDTPM